MPSIVPVSLQSLRLSAGVGDGAEEHAHVVHAGAHAHHPKMSARGRSVSMIEADMPIGKEGLAELEKKLKLSQSRMHSNSDAESENNNSQSSGSLSVCAFYFFLISSYVSCHSYIL